MENKLFYFFLFIYLLCGEGLFAGSNGVYLCENIFWLIFDPVSSSTNSGETSEQPDH
jgi:hypothetical protein